MRTLFLFLPILWCILCTKHLPGQEAELIFPSGHSDDVEAISVAPSGKFLLSASRDGTLKTWDIASGLAFKTYSGHEDKANVYAASFGHKTDSFFVSGGQDNLIIVWNTYTGQPLKILRGHEEPIAVLAVSNDDRFILSGSNDHTAKLWDIEKGICIKTFKGHQQVVRAVAFTDDPKRIVTGSGLPFYSPQDNSIRIWDTETEKEVKKIGDYGDVVNTISVVGNLVVSGSDDSTIRIWDIAKGKEVKKIQEVSFVMAIALSKDGNFALAGLANGIIHLWNIAEGKIEKTFRSNKYKTSVKGIIWNSDLNHFFTAQNADITSWGMLDGAIHHTFQGYSQPAYALAYAHSGKFVVSSNIQESITLWNMQTGREIRSIPSNLFGANRLSLSADDRYLYASYFSGGDNNPLVRYDLENKDSTLIFQGHSSIINSIALSSDNKKIATCSENEIVIWDARTTGSLYKITDQPNVITLAWSSSGDTLCSGDLEGNLWLRDSRGKILHQLKGAKSRIMMAQFSPNGQYLLSGGGPMTSAELTLWDIKKGSMAWQFPASHAKFINSIAFSPNGKLAASGSFDGSICLWDTENKKLMQKWDAHNSFLTDIAFSPDGLYLISSSGDNTLKTWNTRTLKPVLTFFKLDKEEWGILDATNYYSCSRNVAQKIGFKVKDKIFRFEQFDLKYNRPDRIAEQVPQTDSGIINAFKNAYQKRLEKMNFLENQLSDNFQVPQINIINQQVAGAQIMLEVLAFDSVNLLDRLQVFINDVPIYGLKGIDLRSKNTQKHRQTISLELSQATNKIQVSVLNQAGVESFRETTYANYTTPNYKPKLWIVGIGSGTFANTAKNLQYPAKDVVTLTNFLKTNNTLYDSIIIDTLTGRSVTLEHIEKIRKHLNQTKVSDKVILFIAGHGLFDADYNYYLATFDTDFRSPKGNAIPYEILESLLDGIPARQKLLLVDACHAGEIDKASLEKIKKADTQRKTGITFRSLGYDSLTYKRSGLDNAFEMMRTLFTDLRRGTGSTTIASAAGVEFAREGDGWNNSVFVYALIKALKDKTTDSNNNGKITVSEVQKYLAQMVLELTDGLQRPEFRTENISNDWQIW